jgi:hypothetical protein
MKCLHKNTYVREARFSTCTEYATICRDCRETIKEKIVDLPEFKKQLETLNRRIADAKAKKMRDEDRNIQQSMRLPPACEELEQGKTGGIQGQEGLRSCAICGNSFTYAGDPLCLECRSEKKDRFE